MSESSADKYAAVRVRTLPRALGVDSKLHQEVIRTSSQLCFTLSVRQLFGTVLTELKSIYM